MLINFLNFVKDNNIEKIDLIKINIEGGEYDLLYGFLKSGYVKNITDIQVQFHNSVEDAVEKRNDIRKMLSETHELTYDYEFIWENWRLKK